jgi:hypothetical protein
MNVIESFIANPQPTKAVKPRSGSLHDPAVAAQPLARFDASASNARRDATQSQLTAQRASIVGFISVQLRGSLARTPLSLASNRFDSIHDFEHHPCVMHVSRAQECRERDALALDHKMALRARFAAIRRILPGFCAPFKAGTEKESTEARDQSSWSASARRSSNAWCNLRHTPACCHSRNLRQQVVPEPHCISGGRYDHGNPVRSTKIMPRKASRLEMRGRPPFGFSTSGGSSGSTTAHNSSLTSGFAIASDFISPQPRF